MPKLRLQTPLEALDYVMTTLAKYPERQSLPVYEAARNGTRRKHSGLYLGYLNIPEDRGEKVDAIALPEIDAPAGPDGDLIRQLAGSLEPLRMLNPCSTVLGLGKGTGTMVTCFGTALVEELGNTPERTIPLEEALARPVPDPANSGLMPEMRKRIEFLKSRLPAGKGFYIGTPDMQGPFNLAHAVLGEDALMGPYVKPELYQEFMNRMTDLWIAAWKLLWQWIGPEWLAPGAANRLRFAECSVNLVSAEFYREFILPYDLRAAKTLNIPIYMHPCSGPHVFRATLELLPDVAETEAGFIERTAAGSISVEEATQLIAGRPITLHIGQELPFGKEYEFIKRDFDRYAENPRLTFGYTGMSWRIRDRAHIQALHRRLDDYWNSLYGG